MENQVMTKHLVEALRQDIELALFNICEKNGLKRVTLGAIRYNSKGFTTSKLEFSFKSEEQLSQAPLKPESFLNRRFKLRQRVFTIVSVHNANAVIGQTQRGKRYRIPVTELVNMVEI